MEDGTVPFQRLPEVPGVYLMRGEGNRLLYIGKAANLRRRVGSYFLRPHDSRIERLVSEIQAVEYAIVDTPLEALILEAQLIKEHLPPYNIREKDDKSFLYVEITKDRFPRILLVRGTDPIEGERFGPFVSARAVREAVKILRRIFPWSTHPPKEFGKLEKPCFDAQIGLCPGVCVGGIERDEYLKTVRAVRAIFRGKRKVVLRDLKRAVSEAADNQEYEIAAKLQRQVFGLEHINDVSLISEDEIGGEGPRLRIEGYDISHISGTSAVGSMVVFYGNAPAQGEYRKFRIKTVEGSNDTAMLKEVLRRRFRNDWPLPDMILVDGGQGQVNAMREVLDESGLSIQLVGLAKGPERKRNDLYGTLPDGVSEETLIRVRDEAHRFAVKYHRQVRSRL